MKYENKIYGYITLDGEKFAFTFDNYIVKIFNGIKGIFSPHKVELPSMLYGITENNYNIAFCVYTAYQNEHCIIFSTPYFILDKINCYNYDISKFNKISFVGGCVNQIVNPEDIYVKFMDDWQEDIYENYSHIKFKPLKDVSNEFKLNVFNQDIILKYTINPYEKRVKNKLGETNSLINIEFKDYQSISEFDKWYTLIIKMCVLLIAQQNVDFDNIKIYYEINREEASNNFYGSANIYVNTDYIDLADKDSLHCIDLSLFDNVMTDLIDVIIENKISIGFLPKSNAEKKHVTYENIKNICTAAEYEFSIMKLKLPKIKEIELLKKEVKEYIQNFKLNHDNFDEDDFNSILSSVGNWTIPAKKQAFTVYTLNKDVVDYILYHSGLGFSYQCCCKLIDCRNAITHGSRPKLTNQIAEAAYAMKVSIYVSILKRIGLSDDAIKDKLVYVF